MDYTKGEWKAYKDDFGQYSYAVDVKHTGHEKQYTEIAYVCNKDDAQLIAAAPMMYEALKAANNYLRLIAKTKGQFANVLIQENERALAKAEGK